MHVQFPVLPLNWLLYTEAEPSYRHQATRRVGAAVHPMLSAPIIQSTRLFDTDMPCRPATALHMTPGQAGLFLSLVNTTCLLGLMRRLRNKVDKCLAERGPHLESTREMTVQAAERQALL